MPLGIAIGFVAGCMTVPVKLLGFTTAGQMRMPRLVTFRTAYNGPVTPPDPRSAGRASVQATVLGAVAAAGRVGYKGPLSRAPGETRKSVSWLLKNLQRRPSRSP